MILLRYILFFLSTLTLLFSFEPDFTKDELQWIKNNPTVKFGSDYKWPPFDFADSKGNHTGLASEYLKLISKKSGLNIKIETGIWSEVLKNMQSKKYDGLSCAVETDDRKKYLNFTSPYLRVPMVIITTKQNNSIQSIEELKGKKVAINKGSYIHEWLESKNPEINLYLTSSNEASLEAVSLGKADAYVGNLAVATYIMNKYLLNNLKIVEKLKGFDTAISVAIDKENSILFSIIQKSLESITLKEHQELKSRWKDNVVTKKALLSFNKKQSEWIENHKVIRYVIDNDWKPIEFLSKESNKHQGLSKSYLDLISKKTGIEFKIISTDRWSKSVEKIDAREADLYACLAQTESRKKVVNFSDTYIEMPQVFVTNKNVDFIEDITKLYGKKVVLVEGYYITELVKQEHPQIIVVEVRTIKEAFEILTQNKAFAYIDVLAIASANIQKNGFSNLKISGMSAYNYKLSMALRNDWGKEGIEIINMALSSISEEEKNSIYNKWLRVEYDREIDYTLLWQIVGVFLLLIIASLFWNRKLSIEIRKRRKAQIELIELNKKLEEATRKAQSANKSKSDFLSNMSHEIRTPMNAILGFTELLDNNIEDKKLKSFIKTIRSSGQTLLHLINDILDLSKIESGKLQLVKNMVNVESIFNEIIDIFKLQAQQKGLQLSLDLEENMPKSLLLDSVRLKEILINLIGNALKFTEKGYIKVRVVVDEVYEHTSKIDITINVEDSGIGIAKEQQENVFKIFEQTENQDVRKYGGTGLGLSISRKLATLMNGSLELESETGVGSTFIVSLKNIDIASLSDEKTTSQIDIEYDLMEFKPAVILVVDDVEENRSLVKENIANTKVKVLEAVNGKDAIKIVKDNDIDLIFMDIRMPVMDGYRATRIIKEFSTVPIVALTASIMYEELEKLDGERFDGYLRKPVSRNELFGELMKYLKYDNKVVQKVIEEEVSIDNLSELEEFLNNLSMKVDKLHKESKQTNDISVITKFAKSLLELSTKYSIKYMMDYSELLLEKIDSFEIDSISKMIGEYENKIKYLKSKL